MNHTVLVCTKCGKKVDTLHHVKGYDGDYCSICKPPAPPPGPDPYVEDVRGQVIGDMLTNYQLWTGDNTTYIARTTAENDTADAAYFATYYPIEWAAGCCMRIYE